MKLTLEEVFKIEHEFLSDSYDTDVVSAIIEFMNKILEKEEANK